MNIGLEGLTPLDHLSAWELHWYQTAAEMRGCECMLTWYWLANLCADDGIDVVLGHALLQTFGAGQKQVVRRTPSVPGLKVSNLDTEKTLFLLRRALLARESTPSITPSATDQRGCLSAPFTGPLPVAPALLRRAALADHLAGRTPPVVN